LSEPLWTYTKIDQFTKTGSGQTYEKLREKGGFCRDVVEAKIDPADPSATPLALLGAGLALKEMAKSRSGASAAKFAEPAAGMLMTAAGLARPSTLTGFLLDLIGLSPATSIAPAIRLQALLALLDGNDATWHWAGQPGLPGARRAAAAAGELLRAELERGAPRDTVADGLGRLARWCDQHGCDATAAA
jgi:hypothetical protein